jgi:CysZ protein
MKLGKQISIGIKGYTKAVGLLFSKGFIKYMIFPLLLNIVLFGVGISFVKELADWASTAFVDWVNLGEAEFWGASALKWISEGIIGFLIYSMFFIAFIFFGGFIILIILSPLFSIISEKTESVISDGNVNYPFEFKQFMTDVFRGIGIALRNVLFETGIMILVFIIGIILSFVSWLGVIFMFFVSAYFYGFSYMDYTNERHNRNLKKSVRYIRKYKWVAIVNGALFAVVLFIPWIGVALSSFVAVISVIAGTVSMMELKKYEDSETDVVSYHEA